jgi:hypothetical protein
MTDRLTGGLLAIALLLAGVVLYQALAPVTPIAALYATAAQVAMPRASAPYSPPEEAQFAIINDRTVFDPARQAVAEPAPAAAGGALPPDLSLVGVIIGGANSIALLKRDNAREAISARLGQPIDGWSVVRITADSIVLRAGVNEVTLPLKPPPGGPPLAPLNPHPAANGPLPPAETRP